MSERKESDGDGAGWNDFWDARSASDDLPPPFERTSEWGETSWAYTLDRWAQRMERELPGGVILECACGTGRFRFAGLRSHRSALVSWLLNIHGEIAAGMVRRQSAGVKAMQRIVPCPGNDVAGTVWRN